MNYEDNYYLNYGYTNHPGCSGAVVCPYAACIVDQRKWWEHEEWHQKLNQIIDAMNAGDI